MVASYVAVGLYTWWRRPGSRLGPLLVGNGFLYAATSFNASGASPAYTLGMVMWAVYVVYTAYLLLSYPRGRLESGLERTFIGAYALSTAVLTALNLALSPTFPAAGSFNDCGTRCPRNALAGGDAAIGTAVNSAASIVFTIALIGLTMLLLDKARTSGPGLRRAVTPVAAVFTATVAWFVISLYLLPAYPETASAVTIVNGVLGLAIPMAILLGQVSWDRFAAISLGQIAVRARDGAADALGCAGAARRCARGFDSHARAVGRGLGLCRCSRRAGGAPNRPAGARGHASDPARPPVAALIHDPMLDTDSALVEGLAASSLMMLENARLVAELHASRARRTEASDRERRKLERDLHDGAQQRLTGIQVRLRMVQERVDGGELADELDAIGDDAAEAVEELRGVGARHLSARAARLRPGRCSPVVRPAGSDRGRCAR